MDLAALRKYLVHADTYASDHGQMVGPASWRRYDAHPCCQGPRGSLRMSGLPRSALKRMRIERQFDKPVHAEKSERDLHLRHPSRRLHHGPGE